MRMLWSRIRGFVFAGRLDRDLDREIEAHVALIAEGLVERGISPGEARRMAIREFGNICLAKEDYRERRGLPMLEMLIQDVRFAVRVLRRKPAYSIAAMIVLALGIGLSTAVFSVIHGVLLSRLPYPDQDRLLTLWQTNPKKQGTRDEVAIANFLDWKERQRSFENLAVIEPFSHELMGDGEPEAIRSWIVSEGFFSIMGTPPLLGRWFTAEDYRAAPQEGYAPGGGNVVILSYGLWQRRFGGDPKVIGRAFPLRGRPMIVVGVMPPGFQYPLKRELWAPRLAQKQDRESRVSTYMMAVARLKPGVRIDQARDDMIRIATELEREHPATNKGSSIQLIPIADALTGHVRTAFWILLGAVGLLLAVACANVGGLVLARGVERTHELAVRRALGASPGRLMRQLVTETSVLSLCGGIAGVAIAHLAARTLRALPVPDVPRMEQVGISVPVVAFAVAVSAFTAVVCGLLPALRLGGGDSSGAMKAGGRSFVTTPARERARRWLVAGQIAVSMVLLTSAGLLTRSLVHLLAIHPGFTGQRVISLEVHAYRRTPTPEERIAYFRQTTESIRQVPGVQAAAAVSALPFHENAIDVETPVQATGEALKPIDARPVARVTVITPDYFQLMRIPLRQGRFFTDSDGPSSARVAIINEAMARSLFAGTDPVGRQIIVGRGANHVRQIIGVTANTLRTGLDESPRPEFFLPHAQSGAGSMTFVVRTESDPWIALPAIKEAIWSVKRGQPFSKIATVDALVAGTHGERRFQLALISVFAALSLLLAAVALFGFMSYSTSQRRSEIGLRMALGASRRDILRLIISDGLAIAAAGAAAGTAGSWIVGSGIRAMLFGVAHYDVATFASVVLTLAGVTLTASALPAMRAASTDAANALRSE
ncbi:MAG: ABC transporter permease [Bryobacterales bacterium]|nr:ABC transporter permease [Bryobacterales bacterium]